MSQAQPMERIEFVERELEGYREYVKDWKREHEELTKHCWPVEDVIAKANCICDTMMRLPADLRRCATHEGAPELFVRQQHLMREWLELSESVIAEHVIHLEKVYGEVRGAERMRENIRLVQFEALKPTPVEIDVDGKVYESTGELAITPGLTSDQISQGLKDAKAGRTRSLKDRIMARASY
jgi:hypothetical protein